MTIQQQITQNLEQALCPGYLDIRNESDQHNVPENSETHFRVVIVSEQFEGLRQVARHQQVYKALATELEGPVHALALHTFTAAEWEEKQTAPESPQCMGGSKDNA